MLTERPSTLERSMRNVFAIEHPFKGDFLHTIIRLVDRFAQRRAHSSDGEDTSAGRDDLVALDLGSAMEDDGRIVRMLEWGLWYN